MTLPSPMPAPALRQLHHALAFASGGLLAVMLLFNGTLAGASNATFASFVAHASGGLVAGLILLVWHRAAPGSTGPAQTRAPLWAYLGGLSGALIVIVTTMAMNSALALSGTLALGLAGQAVFAVFADRLGLFGLPVRRISARGLLALGLILAGSGVVILGGAA
ncbi:MAG: DMT family transporter [Roseinatronobacter sp.]